MIQRNYGQVKGELARVAGSTGMSVTDPRLLARTNEAIQELMNEGAFPGVVDRWHLIARNGLIVLPSHLDMLLEFTAQGVPQQIMSPWAEFVAYGPGIQEDLFNGSNRRTWWACGGGSVFDRGESPTVGEIPISEGSSCVCSGSGSLQGPWFLRQYANAATNDETTSLIQGLDANGLSVRSEVALSNGSGTQWIDGVQLGISSGSGYTQTTQEFTQVTAYSKPVTNGYVRLTAWNGTDEIELANYSPSDTSPSYHRYYSQAMHALRDTTNPCCRVVLARARRRFVPVANDGDVLLIGNILALKAMMIAQWKRDAGNFDEYAVMKATAVDIMKKEAVAYRGKVRTPALTFQKGFSLGELPAVR